MRRFRRRKPRVAWLPVFGNGLAPEGASPAMGYFETDIVRVPANGSWSLDAYPLTFDQSQDEEIQQSLGTINNTLHDFVSGQEYRLRRVIGSLFLSPGYPGGQSSNPGHVMLYDVAAGLIVARTTEAGALSGAPNPLRQDHATFPWIWRRRWMFRDPAYNVPNGTTGIQWFATSTSTPGGATYGNIGFQGTAGPYFDQKTARVIKQEERLYMMLACRSLISVAPGTQEGWIGVNFDYRLLGSLRQNIGNRRHASR